MILVSQMGSLFKLFEPAIISRLGQSNILGLNGYDEDVLILVEKPSSDTRRLAGRLS